MERICRSYGYAGGTTSTGTVVPRGGFDTILTLFSASGVFIDDNDDGAGAAVDPTTGQAADARITANLAAGSYILAVTEYDNFSIGNLSDGFAETGNHNFTADPNFATGGACPGGMFRDISGTAGRCRTGNWALDFVNVTSVTSVPEPGTTALFGRRLVGIRTRIAEETRRRHCGTGFAGGGFQHKRSCAGTRLQQCRRFSQRQTAFFSHRRRGCRGNHSRRPT